MQHKTDDTNNDVGLRKESHHFTTVPIVENALRTDGISWITVSVV